MKRKIGTTLLALVLLALTLAQSLFAARFNLTITVTSGTPVQLSTNRVIVNRVFIQAKHGGAGIVYVMGGIPTGVTPDRTNVNHVTAELAPASSTAPGGAYSESDPLGIDLSKIWIDVDTTGDKVIVSYDAKN